MMMLSETADAKRFRAVIMLVLVHVSISFKPVSKSLCQEAMMCASEEVEWGKYEVDGSTFVSSSAVGVSAKSATHIVVCLIHLF
jgi:hypothetical protein